jgi:hypothetical protein
MCTHIRGEERESRRYNIGIRMGVKRRGKEKKTRQRERDEGQQVMIVRFFFGKNRSSGELISLT